MLTISLDKNFVGFNVEDSKHHVLMWSEDFVAVYWYCMGMTDAKRKGMKSVHLTELARIATRRNKANERLVKNLIA